MLKAFKFKEPCQKLNLTIKTTTKITLEDIVYSDNNINTSESRMNILVYRLQQYLDAIMEEEEDLGERTKEEA